MEHILAHSMPGNPRNSEGSFVKLSDGTLYFAFSRYSGSSSADHAAADVAAVTSKDNGTTWSNPFIVLKNKAFCDILIRYDNIIPHILKKINTPA